MILGGIETMTGEEKKTCDDPACGLTREGIPHKHPTDEDRKKYKIHRIKEAIKSLFGDI